MNVAHRLAWLPPRMPGAEMWDDPDLLLVDSGHPCDTFNKITRASPALSRTRAEAAVAHFRAKRSPFAWVVTDDRTPRLLERIGLHLAETHEAMTLDFAEFQPAPDVAGLEVVRVTTADQLDAWASIQALNWSPPNALVNRFYALAAPAILSERSPFALWLGSVAGEPVAGVEVFTWGGEAGVYNVSTKTRHRRRGYASALLSAALIEARRGGARRSSLSASAEGAGVYRRLGYRTTGGLCEYIL